MEQFETSLVADLYRINRADGKFSEKENGKKLIRKGCVITKEYFDEVNAETEANGMKYVRDEEATKERAEILKAKLSGEVVEKKKDTALNTELDELRARYKELGGEDSSKTWGVKKLTSEIELLSKQD